MNNLIKDIHTYIATRLNSTLFISFIVSWSIINYDFCLIFLFSEINIENKVIFIKYFNFTLDKGLLLPLIFSISYQFILPLFNFIIDIIKHKTIDNWIRTHKNKKQITHYKEQIEVEKEKIKLEYLSVDAKLTQQEREQDLAERKATLNFKTAGGYKTDKKIKDVTPIIHEY